MAAALRKQHADEGAMTSEKRRLLVRSMHETLGEPLAENAPEFFRAMLSAMPARSDAQALWQQQASERETESAQLSQELRQTRMELAALRQRHCGRRGGARAQGVRGKAAYRRASRLLWLPVALLPQCCALLT